MCAPLGTRCSAGHCVTGNPLQACEYTGASGCSTCFLALIAAPLAAEMKQDANDVGCAPPEALHGRVVSGLGYQLEDVGKSQFQVGDLLLTIAAKDEYPLPVNEAWFAHHWQDMSLPTDQQPTEFAVTFWRPGERSLRSLTVTRA